MYACYWSIMGLTANLHFEDFAKPEVDFETDRLTSEIFIVQVDFMLKYLKLLNPSTKVTDIYRMIVLK